ncbi:MAG: response regulator [bacterium]
MSTRILMVDDEKSLTEMIKLELEETGEYEVLTENDARNALAQVRRWKPDLVLLDIMMPYIDGPGVAEQLKSHPDTADTRLLFLSSIVTRADTRENGHTVSGNFLLSKPVKMEVLREAIWAATA